MLIGVAISINCHHSEGDGQTEIMNTHLEQCVGFFCYFTQADWANWLPLAEFFANNTVSTTTGMSPFFANSGQNPRLSFGYTRKIQVGAPASKRKMYQAGNLFVTNIEEITNLTSTNMLNAQAPQKHQASANRSSTTA